MLAVVGSSAPAEATAYASPVPAARAVRQSANWPDLRVGKAFSTLKIRRLGSCRDGEGAHLVAQVALVRAQLAPVEPGRDPPRDGPPPGVRQVADSRQRAGGAAGRPARDRRAHAV